MKFVHYIREQMMQEYGFDLNDPAGGNEQFGPGQLGDIKKLKAEYKE
jgi:hypothetical protein